MDKMAGCTFPGRERLMLIGEFQFQAAPGMTGEAELGRPFPELNPADHTMGQMTAPAVPGRHRLMNKAAAVSRGHLMMTIQAALRRLMAGRGG